MNWRYLNWHGIVCSCSTETAKDVLKSDEIKDFINEKYDGAVIPFDDSTDAE